MALMMSMGCQTSRFANLDLPVPPQHLTQVKTEYSSQRPSMANADVQQNNSAELDTSSLDEVRFQSPDSPAWNDKSLEDRLKNLSRLNPALDSTNSRDSDRSQRVAEVIIKGNQRVPTHHLTRSISTRPGRFFDPDRLQQDVDQLWRMPEINRVRGPFLKETPGGIVVTIEVDERLLIREVDFVGNRGITDRQLQKNVGLAAGDPLDIHRIRMAKKKLEELYRSKGYSRTQVDILEGDKIDDAKVVFLIHEDQQQRIWKAEFEGNQIASDARLRNFIESKPGILKMIGGLVNREEIDQDVLRLTNYYRSLGFFNARIGREISESNDGRWLTVRFIINEGPRYRVRNISFVGNNSFQAAQLARLVELKPNEEGQPEFNVAKMNKDVVSLRDLYGSQGYVFADVQAEPRFLEEPGLLDIVYKVNEGKQYRVGNINVHFEGDYGITKREVVLNRLSVRPGELIDVREIRNSERRLGAAQIFAAPGTPGASGPKIVVRPPEAKELERYAQGGTSSGSSTHSRGSATKHR